MTMPYFQSVLVLGSVEEEERTFTSVGRGCKQRRRHIPVVVLGLLAGLLANSEQWLHWRFAKLRASQGSGRSQSWISTGPGAAL